MKYTHRIQVWLMAAGCFAPIAAAQQPVAPTAVKFEFSVMASERMPNVGYAQIKPQARARPRPAAGDFEIKPLRISSQGRSSLYAYEGTLPIRLVETQSSGGVVSAIRMIGSISEPFIPQRAMLFLTPNADDLVNTMILDDSATAFPASHVRIVNLADGLVQGALNGHRFEVDETKTVLPPQRVTESVKVVVAFERQGRPIVVFDQSLRVSENERLLLVFLPPYRVGADVRVRVVRDQVRAPAVE